MQETLCTRAASRALLGGRSTRMLEVTEDMPRSVRAAITLLWIAWGISVGMILLRGLRLGGADVATFVGIAAALVQGLIIYFIGMGNNVARIALIVLILLAIPSLVALHRDVGLVVARLPFSALASAVSFVLKVAACIILFTVSARPWFRRRKASVGGL